MACEHGLGGGGIGSRGQHIDAIGRERGEDIHRLFGRFSRGEDNFRKADAQTAVMVHAGVAKVFEGEGGEALRGSLGSEGAAFDLGEQFQQRGRCHGFTGRLAAGWGC